MSIQKRTRLGPWCASLILMLTFCPSLASAQWLSEPFFLHLVGDDPARTILFDTPFADAGPTLLTLDGFAVNLESEETIHCVSLEWFDADGILQHI